jgi:outer membrane protein assembly factor BamB
MRRKLLAAGVVIVLLGGAAGAYKVLNKEDPPEKRGSAKVEFDATAKPEPAKPTKETGEAWPTFGYDLQRTKVSPYDHRPPFRRTWRIDAHDTIEFPPSAAYGNVYIPQQKGLFFAVNGKTGKLRFRKSYKRCAASSPTIGKGVVYQAYMDFVPCQQGASNPTGFVVAMDAKTGREKWRFKGQPFESTPLLRKGILYVGSWDGNVYAIRAKTGRKIWSYQTGDRVNTSGAYSNGRIFIANNSGTVYAINASTGKLAWSGSQATEFFYAAPAVAYGRVFIGSSDGTMYAYGQKSGKLLWAKPLGTYIYSSAAIYDKKVYAGTYDGKFYALDAATGDTRWQADMPSAVHAPPVVMGGLVYAATCSSCGSAAARSVKTGKDSTTAFNAKTGRKVWFNNGGKYASPIIADRDRVYFTGRSYEYGFEPVKKAKR